MRTVRFWVGTWALVLTCCSSGNPSLNGLDTGLGRAGTGANGGDDGSGTGGTTPGISLGGGAGTHAGSAGTANVDTSGCGDGLLQAAALGEVCDDGNSASGDGCAAD